MPVHDQGSPAMDKLYCCYSVFNTMLSKLLKGRFLEFQMTNNFPFFFFFLINCWKALFTRR